MFTLFLSFHYLRWSNLEGSGEALVARVMILLEKWLIASLEAVEHRRKHGCVGDDKDHGEAHYNRAVAKFEEEQWQGFEVIMLNPCGNTWNETQRTRFVCHQKLYDQTKGSGYKENLGRRKRNLGQRAESLTITRWSCPPHPAGRSNTSINSLCSL